MDFDEINKILDIVREHELSEFELEREGFKIRIKKGNVEHASGHFAGQMVPAVLHHPGAASAAPVQPSAPEAVPPSAASTAAAAAAAQAAEEVDLGIVKSPIVGTFFRSSEPGAAPFVEVGDTVKKGQVLCIIEAMKLMNEIDSELDGEVVKVYVENGQPVQYGERLFAIKARSDV
jgi:acetyl-CoA carboxylase biotin carboxyl carrier protein